MKNSEGQKVPQVSFKTLEAGGLGEVSSQELFAGKKVILFALPGAFTPTCSSTHVPRFNQLAPGFKENGIDEVICLSVNDPFVMDAWHKDQGADRLRFLSDGNGEFSEQMGLLVDKSDLSFGKRSWRYSMYIEDGVIQKMFIEPEEPGDPFKVSDADTMWEHLFSDKRKPADVSLFAKEGCPHCARAKALLDSKGIAYEQIVLGKNASAVSLQAVTGRATVPQVFVNGEHIGGADDLEKYFAN